VPVGILDHFKCGEVSFPVQPKPLNSCCFDINSPCVISVLESVSADEEAEINNNDDIIEVIKSDLSII